MTIRKTIETARQYLPGNPGAYARVMSGAIRAAASDRAATQLRVAVMVDGMAGHFNEWSTACPTAKAVL